MRISTTLILALAVFILGWAIRVVDHKPTTGASAASLAQVLWRFEATDVDRLVIERGVHKTVVEKKSEAWYLTEPEADRADARIIASLLDQLNHLAIVDVLDPEETGQSKQDLGLSGEALIKVTLRSAPKGAKASEVSLSLGAESPRSNAIYASRSGESAHFVVDGNPRAILTNPEATLLDRHILSAPVDRIVQLAVRKGDQQIALQRRIVEPVQSWSIYQPISTWADPKKLDELLAGFAALQIEEVIRDQTKTEAIPETLPEGAAVVQVMVYGFETPLTVYLTAVPEPEAATNAANAANAAALPLIEARLSDRPWVYRCRSRFLEDLPGSALELRNRTLARIPMTSLDRIYIHSQIDPRVDLQSQRVAEGLRWDVKLNNKLVPANLTEVGSLVDQVNEAIILDFATDEPGDLAPYGLAPPDRKIDFLLQFPAAPQPDGSPGPPQEITRSLLLGWAPGETRRRFAQFEGEPAIFELDPTFLSLMPTHPVKWRSLSVLAVNAFHLQSITREIFGQERITLTYDRRFDRWTGSRDGIEISNLDLGSVRRLQERICSLSASGWWLSLAQAREALLTPSARFEIVTSEFDPAVGEARPKTYQITLAPGPTEIWFGQIEGSLDIFYLDYSAYRGLNIPVTTAR